MTRPRLLPRLVLCATTAVLILGACGGGDGDRKDEGAQGKVATGQASDVHIMNFQFAPAALTVKPGDKVTWTNDDTAIHSIKDTSPLATPVSQDLGKGATFSISYDRPGSYSYICGIHQYMTGTVTVAP
jgi:plastocyanin